MIRSRVYLAILAIVSSVTAFFVLFPAQVESIKSSTSGNTVPAPALEDEVTYSQTFKSKVNNLSEISIPLATYHKRNRDGVVEFSLINSNKDTIVSSRLELKGFEDNSNYVLRFDAIADSLDKEYTLNIKYVEYYDEDTLCFFVGDSEGTPAHTENNEAADRVINFQESGTNPCSRLYYIWWGALIIMSVLLLLSVDGKVAFKKGKNHAKNR